MTNCAAAHSLRLPLLWAVLSKPPANGGATPVTTALLACRPLAAVADRLACSLASLLNSPCVPWLSNVPIHAGVPIACWSNCGVRVPSNHFACPVPVIWLCCSAPNVPNVCAFLAQSGPHHPRHPSAVHECWQLDTKEGIHLTDGTVASVCTIRDVVGAAILTSRAFDVSSPGRYRKLTWLEIRSVIRSACSEWETLPDVLQTDNEVCLAGQPSDPMPSHLTLWLAGLGVIHRLIRPGQPTDQAQIERTHRTLDNFTGMADGVSDLESLQERLDAEREQYNRLFPARASDCAGRAPLSAHPELRKPRRAYRLEWERQLFDQQRVYECLASFVLERKVSKGGQIQLGGCSRGVGRAYAGQTLVLGCDPDTQEWVVRTAEGSEVVRLAIQGVDVSSLTGLPDEPLLEAQPIQLTLPWLVA